MCCVWKKASRKPLAHQHVVPLHSLFFRFSSSSFLVCFFFSFGYGSGSGRITSGRGVTSVRCSAASSSSSRRYGSSICFLFFSSCLCHLVSSLSSRLSCVSSRLLSFLASLVCVIRRLSLRQPSGKECGGIHRDRETRDKTQESRAKGQGGREKRQRD